MVVTEIGILQFMQFSCRVLKYCIYDSQFTYSFVVTWVARVCIYDTILNDQ